MHLKPLAGKTLYQVYYGPAEPPVNSTSVGSCLRLPVLLWLLLQAPAAAQDPELPPPTPPATSALRFQDYLDRTYGWQTLSWLATDTAIDHLRSRPEWGRGPGGFSCQYASAFGRRLISNSAELAVGLVLPPLRVVPWSHQLGTSDLCRLPAFSRTSHSACWASYRIAC